ncbi:MAG: hypothetical protein QXS19_07055 [Candidatus Methanomethylicia archaeon]
MNNIRDILIKSQKDHFILLKDLTNTITDNFVYSNLTGGFFTYFTGIQSLLYTQNTIISQNFDTFLDRFRITYNPINNTFNNSLSPNHTGTEDNMRFLELHNMLFISETNYTNFDFNFSTMPREEIYINQLARLHSIMLSTGFHLNYDNSEYHLTTINNVEYSLLLYKKFKMTDYYNSALAVPLYVVYKKRNTIRMEKYCDSYMINFYYNIFDDDYAEKLYFRREVLNNKNNFSFNFVYFTVQDVEERLNIVKSHSNKSNLINYIKNKNESSEMSDISIMANRNNPYYYILFNVYLYYQDIENESENNQEVDNQLLNMDILYIPNELNIVAKRHNNITISTKLKSDTDDQDYNFISTDQNNVLYRLEQNNELAPLTREQISNVIEMIKNNQMYITYTHAKFSQKNYAFYQYVRKKQDKSEQIGFVYLIIVPTFIICYADAIIKAEGNIKYTSVKFISENADIFNVPPPTQLFDQIV